VAQIKFQTSRVAEPEDVRTQFLVVPIGEGEIDAPALRRLDRKLGGSLLRHARDAAFTGKESSGVLHRVENGGALRAVYLVGSDTGRDGIAGASLLASFELGTGSDQKRPSVQVGNPFLEKLLLEATLELVAADAIEAVQDLGAAGLTCATSEVAAKSGVGMRIDVSLVPRRARAMTPYEVMLSESQERMLVVARPGRERDVERIFTRAHLGICFRAHGNAGRQHKD